MRILVRWFNSNLFSSSSEICICIKAVGIREACYSQPCIYFGKIDPHPCPTPTITSMHLYLSSSQIIFCSPFTNSPTYPLGHLSFSVPFLYLPIFLYLEKSSGRSYQARQVEGQETDKTSSIKRLNLNDNKLKHRQQGVDFSSLQDLTDQIQGFELTRCYRKDLEQKATEETLIFLVRWKLHNHMGQCPVTPTECAIETPQRLYLDSSIS